MTHAEKDSISQSVVAFAELLLRAARGETCRVTPCHRKVALKIWVTPPNESCTVLSSLRYEARVYQLVTQTLSPFTPCLVAFVAFGTCQLNSIKAKLDLEGRKKIVAFLRDFVSDPRLAACLPTTTTTTTKKASKTYVSKTTRKQLLTLDVLITERASCEDGAACSFLAWTKDARRNAKEMFGTIWMILFTIQVMIEKRVQQNDLHLKNILMKSLKRQRRYVFAVSDDSHAFAVTTSVVPLIFDWDRSYAKKVGDNPRLHGYDCIKKGTCNVLNPFFDAYTFLWHVRHSSPLKSVRDFVDRQIADWFRTGVNETVNAKTGTGHYGLLPSFGDGSGAYVPNEEEMKPVLAMFQDQAFAEFQASNADVRTVSDKNLYTLPSVNRAKIARPASTKTNLFQRGRSGRRLK